MRTFALILVLVLPPLAACGAAYAKTSTELGKPVCSHYDDSSKPAASASAEATPAIASPAVAASATAPATTTTATGKGGGTANMGHTRAAPHWQTFLPGMFR